MQMTLTITAESPAEMVTVLAALQSSGVGVPVQLQAVQAAPVAATPVLEQPQEVIAPRRGRPPKTAVVEEAPAPKPEPPKPEPPKPEPAKPEPKLKVVPKQIEEKEITILDVRKALTAYLQANDETKAAALLIKHGHTDRLSKLEDQYLEAVYHAAVTPAVKDEFFNDEIPDLVAK